MVIRERADTAIAVIGLGRQFLRPAGTSQALAVEAASQALADAGFPGGRGLSRDRAGVIIGTTLVRPALTGVPAPAGPRDLPVLTAEKMAGTGLGTIAGQVCARFGFNGASHTVDSSRFSSLLAVAAACSALAADDLDFVLAGGVDTGPRPGRHLPGNGCGVVALMRARDAISAGAPVYAEITGWGMCATPGTGTAPGGRGRTSPSLRRACRQARIDPAAERLVIDTGRSRAAGAIAGVLRAAESVSSGSELAEVSGRGFAGGTVNLLLRRAEPGYPSGSAGAAPGLREPAGMVPPQVGLATTAAGQARIAAGPPGDGHRGARRPSGSLVTAGDSEDLEIFAFSGDDPAALIAALNRIAEIAPRMSGPEQRHLARQLRRSPPRGRTRAAFAVAPARDRERGDLAGLARRAARLLTGLPAGVLRSAAGVYAGRGVQGRTVLLFPSGLEAAIAAPPAGSPAAGDPELVWAAAAWRPPPVTGIYRASRDALCWLDRIGVTPAAAIGHGPGELAGLAWAGCMSPDHAERLITERDRIIRAHRGDGTAMLRLAADAVTSRTLCDGTDLVIAAYNGPRAHVLAGPAAQVRMAAGRAAAEGIAVAVMPATPAFHSPAMATCAAAFREVLAEVEFAPPLRRLISTITGREIGRQDNIAASLADQFTTPVRFLEAVRAVARETDLFCAAGPGHVLAHLAGECWPLPAVTVHPGAHLGTATAAAALFAAGAVTTLDRLFDDHPADFPGDEVHIARPRTAGADSGAPAGTGRNVPDQDEPRSEDIGRYSGNHGKHPGKIGSGTRTLDGQGFPALPETAPAPRRPWTMTVQRPTGSERKVTESMPDAPGTTGPPEKAGPWAHCFTEVLLPLGRAGYSGSLGGGASGRRPGAAAGPWRIRIAGHQPPRIAVTNAFRDHGAPRIGGSADGGADGSAGAGEGLLCYVADPAGPGAADALLEAGNEAAGLGRLVVVTHGPGLAGFCRSLLAQHPRLGITLIRAPQSNAGVRAARQFAATEPGEFRELALSANDPAFAAAVTIEPVAAVQRRGAAATAPVSEGITTMGPADSVLVTVGSGGAASTGLACAEAVGRTGAAVALLGPDHPGGELRAGVERLRAAGACAGYEFTDLTDPGATAEAIGRLQERLGRVTAVVHTGGIGATTDTGAAPGEAPPAAGGHTAPPADGGPPGGISGSAMDDVLAAVTGALDNVLGVVAHSRLRLVVTFGSVAAGQGRLAGGERDALASGALRNYAERLRGHLARCRVLHVDWPPSTALPAGQMLLRFLTTPGAPDTIIVHDPEAAAEAVPAPEAARPAPRAGSVPAPVAAPVPSSPSTPRPAPVPSAAPTPAPGSPSTPQPAPVPGSMPAPVPGSMPGAAGGRFLESVLVHDPGSELVAEARISLATDPYLTDYRTDGETVLPTVMGLEALAEAASALAGRRLARAEEIALGAPVVVPRDRPAVIRVSARNLGGTVETVLRSAETGYRSGHVRALFPLGGLPRRRDGQPYPRDAVLSAPPALAPPSATSPSAASPSGTSPSRTSPSRTSPSRTSPSRTSLAPPASRAPTSAAARSGDGAEHLLDGMTGGIVDGTELYGPLRFPAGRFRRVAFLPALSSRSCRALLRGTDDKPWFGPALAPLEVPLLLGSPGVNDASMHVLQACVPHRKLIPVGCESLTCSGGVVSGAVEVRAAERSGGEGEYVWDVQAVDTDGRPVVSWAGLRLRDAGPLRRDEPWSPMLLAVYLERGAASLGLDPGLRITVRAGHPRPAAGIPVRSAGDDAPGGAVNRGAVNRGAVNRAANTAGDTAGDGGASTPRDHGPREAVAGIYAIAGGAAAGGGAGAAGNAQLQLGSVLYPAAGAGGRARRSHLDGLTLMVDGAFPAACEWAAADGARSGNGGEEWAEELGPGFPALRSELLERCGEPAALVDARIWTAAQCISKAGRRSGRLPLITAVGPQPGPEAGRDGRWVLLRTGDAAIASTVVRMADVPSPVAVAIMAGAAGPAAQQATNSPQAERSLTAACTRPRGCR